MLQRALLRTGILLSLTLGLAACLAFQHGATLTDYEGQVLKVESGKGGERLRLETGFDATIANWVGQHGKPDYLHVQSGSVVELCYIEEDRMVTFTRGWTSNSTATVTEPIPGRLSQMFIRADRDRLVELRKHRRGDAPESEPIDA